VRSESPSFNQDPHKTLRQCLDRDPICPVYQLYGKVTLSIIGVASNNAFEIVGALSRQDSLAYRDFAGLYPSLRRGASPHILDPVPHLGLFRLILPPAGAILLPSGKRRITIIRRWLMSLRVR